ncbi:MAG: TonB-dependent receptor [Brevundimonas sp.]|uniref:TonB-dependent receptor n=1 Tax=Brevundimonas sp. TaxID=1871086 RepID=UPI002736663E|nr:TonB-dependent receptor [Brevundimonas sp.]MDP3655824.1 TonB-dependent receptor [Brevundimonas sp.]MDZ4113696.1 TonB-dependent receptor [Brevundimonas sp.]
MRAILLASACAIAQAVVITPAQAQAQQQQQEAAARSERHDRDAAKLDEVIVTATRREERLRDVPVSITALSQEELNERGIVNYDGLATATPGVVLNRASANFNNFTARGIATNGYGANLQSTVAIYLDELPISSNGNSTILDPSLYDVERIEFLRGPQGTLFGSGSLAGALRILTHDPDPTRFAASGLVDLGTMSEGGLRQRYNAMVNIPLVEDQLALRIVGFSRHEEGWVDNVGTGIENSNSLVQYGGRAILMWEPTDRFSARLMYSREIANPHDSSLTNPTRGEFVRLTDRPDLFQSDMVNYNATFEYQFDGARLTSSSTQSDYTGLFYVDLAGTFGQAFPFALDADAWDKTFVQEVRLVSDPGGRFDWSLGGFYFRKRRDVDFNYRSDEAFLAARGITGLPDEYYLRSGTHFIAHEVAAFGQLTYRFTPDLWVTGGLRYGTTDAQGFTEPGGYNSNYLTMALFGLSGPITTFPIPEAVGVKAEESGLSHRLSLSWRPTPSVTTYAAVSTGFRPPIVNARAGAVSTLDPTDIIIPDGATSDNLTNYELGVKGRWFGGRLLADVAVYWIDWSDIQVQANRVSDSVQFATNIGGATSKGIELSVVAIPVDGLTLALTGGLNQAKVDDLTPAEAAISGAVLDARLAGPEFQGSLRVNYEWQPVSGVIANASVAVSHVGSFPNSFPNTPGRPLVPLATYDDTDSYTFVNANFALAFDQFTVAAYVENLFDDRSVNYIHPEAFLDGRYGRLRPRTIGVRVGYEY